MKKYLIEVTLLILIFSTNSITAQKWYRVKPTKGQGIFSLLRTYDLLDSTCNLYSFYKLNNLQEGEALDLTKEYILPIQLFNYNGVSIRSTTKNNNLKRAKRIQSYNNTMFSLGLKKKKYTKDKILWVPEHEINCLSEKIIEKNEHNLKADLIDYESTKGNRIYPVFGKKYEYTPLIDSQLKGKVFYIVSGHGGPDPGAIANKDGHYLCEDEYAYDVSLRLSRELISHGAIAYIIVRDKNDGIRDDKYLLCDHDEFYWGKIDIALDQVDRLTTRGNIVNKLYEENKSKGNSDQTLIIIHIDSRNKSKRSDVYFYHFKDSKSGKKLANNLQSTFKEKYKKHRASREYEGSVSSRNLFMLRETLPTSVFIELANIRNSSDQKRLLLSSNRQALAKWIFEGAIK